MPDKGYVQGMTELEIDKIAKDIAHHTDADCGDCPYPKDLGGPGYCEVLYMRVQEALSRASMAAGEMRAQALLEAAELIDGHQETVTETAKGSERHLTERMFGNLMGTAYSAAIRALSQSPSPGVSEVTVTKTLEEQAEANVLAVRGSYDAPGFDLCVKAEMRRLSALPPPGKG